MTTPRRFYSLDAVRGIAALAVVFNHWKHFSMVGTAEGSWGRSDSPFYSVLFPLYEYGWVAVDFFFSLSGFVFFWLYSEKIARREVPVGRFALLRFSRLYPLHLATLVLVALLQGLHWRVFGDFAVYPDNDLPRFLQHAVFASGLAVDGAESFNAPVWSVSIEVVMYATFFAVCLLPRGRRPGSLLVLVLAGLALQLVHPNLGRGLTSFFLGGLTHHVYLRLVGGAPGKRRAALLGRAALLALGGCAALVLLQLRYEWFSDGAAAMARTDWITGLGVTAQKITHRVPNLLLLGIVFPIVVLSLSLLETVRGPLFRPLAVLGDWSYAAYLLHFPLQLILILACAGLGIGSEVFRHPLSIPIFFALLCALSQLSYRYFERPMQDWFRGR